MDIRGVSDGLTSVCSSLREQVVRNARSVKVEVCETVAVDEEKARSKDRCGCLEHVL